MKYHDLVCTVNNKKVEENQVKKILTLVLALAMSLSLCACGGKSGGEAPAESEEPDAVASPDGESEGSGIQVDEGLLSVEITIPASFFEEKTEDEIKADAEENGFTGCTVNEDGSVTYKMSKARHREMMDGMKASLEEQIEALVNGEEAVQSFQKIEYSEDFSEFDVYVDPAAYTSWDSLYVMFFYLSGVYYQAFDGKDAEDIDVVVEFIDSVSNEVLESASYREWINSANAEG